jgi:glycosyltransferase involved in cell wall biosynthesis
MGFPRSVIYRKHMMHIVLNGSFWTQPTVGSGQYLHGLLRWLPRVAPQHRYTLLLPAIHGAGAAPPAGVLPLLLRTPFDAHQRNLAKLWFEQVSVPQAVRLLHQQSALTTPTLLHVPYFAPPLHSIVPIVVTIPDLIPLLLPDYRGGPHIRAYMRLVSHTIHHTQRVITFSQHSRGDIAARLGLPASRIAVTLLAAEERYSPASAEHAVAEVAARYGLRQPFIYYVGGLDARKNVEVLLRALALLRQQGDWLPTLAIAGRALGRNTRLFPDLDAQIAALGLHDVVQRLTVPYEDGPLLYRACTLFAFPSRYEGFGLPPLEAMACGAPVIVSQSSSLPEVVGDAAMRVAPDDVAGWAAALHQLLTDPALRARLRARGLAQAARFSWRQVAEETLHLYAESAQATSPT